MLYILWCYSVKKWKRGSTSIFFCDSVKIRTNSKCIRRKRVNFSSSGSTFRESIEGEEIRCNWVIGEWVLKFCNALSILKNFWFLFFYAIFSNLSCFKLSNLHFLNVNFAVLKCGVRFFTCNFTQSWAELAKIFNPFLNNNLPTLLLSKIMERKFSKLLKYQNLKKRNIQCYSTHH